MPSKSKAKKKASSGALSSSFSSAPTSSPSSIKDAKAAQKWTKLASLACVECLLLSFALFYIPRTPISSPSASVDGANIFKNPRKTVASALLGTLPVQVWWARELGKWRAEAKGSEGASGGRKKAKTLYEWAESHIITALVTLAGAVVLHLLVILFGAPYADRTVDTFLLASYLSLLGVLVPAHFWGLKHWQWNRVFSAFNPTSPEEVILLWTAVGTLVGAWAGAFAIPLDWERDWQASIFSFFRRAWPLPPVFGALGGHMLSLLGATFRVMLQ